MREIKFRAWDAERKKMTEFPLSQIGGYYGAGLITLCGESDSIGDTYDLDLLKVPVMQYTGLKDKNGREIYEGDVCSLHDPYYDPLTGKNPYDIFQVMWSNGSWWASFIDSTECLFDLSEDGKAGQDIEVIGNIYENPELTK